MTACSWLQAWYADFGSPSEFGKNVCQMAVEYVSFNVCPNPNANHKATRALEPAKAVDKTALSSAPMLLSRRFKRASDGHCPSTPASLPAPSAPMLFSPRYSVASDEHCPRWNRATLSKCAFALPLSIQMRFERSNVHRCSVWCAASPQTCTGVVFGVPWALKPAQV